jgi:hypothetical protein
VTGTRFVRRKGALGLILGPLKRQLRPLPMILVVNSLA